MPAFRRSLSVGLGPGTMITSTSPFGVSRRSSRTPPPTHSGRSRFPRSSAETLLDGLPLSFVPSPSSLNHARARQETPFAVVAILACEAVCE